ncbi:MAG: hypothetical protein EOM37_02280 [Proteobacteria bacterium]|jgi:hypothetical protein|nr:hypothetical protein [Alphaproteobacteria bacterium]NCC02863.1 hypothetical protein [Pseudomonadota bacterium]
MTEQEKKPMSLKEKMAREEEIQDWDEYIGMKCIRTARERDEAQEQGNQDLAKKLDQEWEQWVDVKDKGYFHAEETELGRAALAHIREVRRKIDK